MLFWQKMYKFDLTIKFHIGYVKKAVYKANVYNTSIIINHICINFKEI